MPEAITTEKVGIFITASDYIPVGLSGADKLHRVVEAAAAELGCPESHCLQASSKQEQGCSIFAFEDMVQVTPPPTPKRGSVG